MAVMFEIFNTFRMLIALIFVMQSTENVIDISLHLFFPVINFCDTLKCCPCESVHVMSSDILEQFMRIVYNTTRYVSPNFVGRT